jgi:hypothetical protein
MRKNYAHERDGMVLQVSPAEPCYLNFSVEFLYYPDVA